jgi:3-deoxy-D-manno-octulosonic-acid transferase
MYFLYSLLLTAGFVVLLPRFLWDAVRHGKYAAGFGERTGGVEPVEAGGQPVVWLHCVSVGETQAARPLARAVLDAFPEHALVVSTTTLTGQRLARAAFDGLALRVFYFPFDWAWSVRRSLRRVNPAAVLVMETELWPRFLSECRASGVPVALLNGRISENSFRRYRLVKSFIGRVLGDIDLAVMQSAADAERLLALGARPERVKVSGNVKFDLDDGGDQLRLTEELRQRFRTDRGGPLVVAASTHAPEERIVIDSFIQLRRVMDEQRPRLMIAPRHPERFDEVAALLDSSGVRWARRSRPAADGDAECEAVLLDTVGELRAVYPLAELVFVGGSVARVGGHNVIEPAAAARCVVTGAHTSNFKAVVRAFLERGALVQLPDLEADEAASAALAGVFRELLEDGPRRRRIGEAARAVIDENRGATGRTVALLRPLLEAGPPARPARAHAGTELTPGR